MSQDYSEYIANRFAGCPELPAQDTGFLKPWDAILLCSELYGAGEAINTRVCTKRPVAFRSPDRISICVEDSFAGRIPVIRVPDISDFEALVTNVAYKGIRPDNIDRTGASFIHGKTTRFIILSTKPYSNVPAGDLGLDEAEWPEQSMQIRFGHECTHYFTKQTYGITNNILHDEIMADFTGLYETYGFFRAEWFLRFMGLVGDSGGRLILYTEELSADVREKVSGLLTEAAYGLERWSESEYFSEMTVQDRIKAMCMAGLEGIAKM